MGLLRRGCQTALDGHSSTAGPAARTRHEFASDDPEVLAAVSKQITEDTAVLNSSAVDVYEFLFAAKKWPDRLPHVASVVAGLEADSTQLVEIDSKWTSSLCPRRTSKTGHSLAARARVKSPPPHCRTGPGTER